MESQDGFLRTKEEQYKIVGTQYNYDMEGYGETTLPRPPSDHDRLGRVQDYVNRAKVRRCIAPRAPVTALPRAVPWPSSPWLNQVLLCRACWVWSSDA